jgi:hypothetical protein
MIYVTNTPNNAGVAIHGDWLDFDELYGALHVIGGVEKEHPSHDSVRTRVLGVCYDVRHALMGDREIEFVDNGMDEIKMKRLSVITHNKNIYLKINVLWPEILFFIMVLNDFILLGQKKCRHPQWDKTITAVRRLQAAVSECIKRTVSDAAYKRMLNVMIRNYTWFDHYATQYVDLLNCRFLAMDKEKRLKNIPLMAKRLAEQGDEYREVKNEVLAAAREYNCTVDDIRFELEYPENIEW